MTKDDLKDKCGQPEFMLALAAVTMIVGGLFLTWRCWR